MSIIRGLLDGIVSKFNDVKNFVGGIGSWIAAHKGPISYDRQLLVPHGGAMMAGLNEGLMTGFGQVQGNVGSMAGRLSIGSLDFATSSVRSAAVAGSAHGNGGFDYDRLAAAFARVHVNSYLDGKNVTAAVDQRLAPR